MKFKQVIVVTKLSPKALRPQTKHIHRQTLRNVLRYLKTLPLSLRVFDRSRIQKPLRADLILTVGGDGTALAASHFAGQTPIFGINSAPQTSLGFFCLANPANFRRFLKQILNGKRKPLSIPRLETRLNGRRLKPYGLNELLFASRLQGETARYLLQIGNHKEEQKSSGVWVATGAGSTGAIHSAGGKKGSPFSKKLQYLVREPCRFPRNHFQLLRGFPNASQTIKITSQMRAGMVFIDGGKWHYKVPKGGVISVRGGMSPLKIFL